MLFYVSTDKVTYRDGNCVEFVVNAESTDEAVDIVVADHNVVGGHWIVRPLNRINRMLFIIPMTEEERERNRD